MPSEIVFRLPQGSQELSIGDTLGLRGRLTERNLAEQNLKTTMSNAIRLAERGGKAVIEPSPDQRGALRNAIGLEKADRGLSAELARLEQLLQS